MVTESTTESEPDDVSLLAIQSPGNTRIRYSWKSRVGAPVSIISSTV